MLRRRVRSPLWVPPVASGYRGRGNATHFIGNSVSRGLKWGTVAGNDSDKENSDATIGDGTKFVLPHNNIFFQQDMKRDEQCQKQNRRPEK